MGLLTHSLTGLTCRDASASKNLFFGKILVVREINPEKASVQLSSQVYPLAFDLQVGFQHVDFTITSVSKNVPYKFGLWITQVVKREHFPVVRSLV